MLSDHQSINLDLTHLRLILDAAPNGILVVDHTGKIVLVNAQVECLFQYTRQELIGKSIDILVPESARAQHPKDREAFMREPRQRAMGAGRDLFGLRRDGVQIPVEIGLNPLKTDTDTYVVASVVDITERKNSEAVLREKVLELERSNDDLQQFAYVCSHDLQEPLRVISNYTQLLARRYQGKLDQNANDFIEFIVEATRRMQELINDLLLYSRVQSRAEAFRDTDSADVIQRAIKNLSVSIDETKTKIIIQEELPHVNADFTQMIQVFQNLISNAIKFRSTELPIIKVSAAEQGPYWQFTVEDNGIGFDMKYADRIFIIFQRLHTRDKYAGSGIGLAVCKKIIERHGGRCSVISEPGKGSAFTFTLPKAAPRGLIESD